MKVCFAYSMRRFRVPDIFDDECMFFIDDVEYVPKNGIWHRKMNVPEDMIRVYPAQLLPKQEICGFR